MDLESRVRELERELKKIKKVDNEKECSLCYGKGYITTPSGENDISCWTCNGTGTIKDYYAK